MMATDGSWTGKTIGKYRLVEPLGRGGMAEVYKAYQPGLDRYVAVKLMHSFLAEDKDFLARFQREAKLVASLRHPNIVQVHDFDTEGGMYYMVMEYIDGETLKSRLQNLEERNQWISIDEAVRIILSIGSALKYAHRMGMVHRDVKPANVMIDTHGSVILTDFGIAKIFAGGAGTQLTASGAMVGTPSYMSPEQGLGQAGDERSDIYSLGVMLYQMVTARLPFEADTPLAVVLKHVNEPPPPPRQVNPETPEIVERIIVKALAKNPDERYQHVGDMLNDLKRAMGVTLDETPTDTMRGRALPAGATSVGTGAITPYPTSARTAVGKPSVPTVVGQEPSVAARRGKAPGLVIALGVLGVLFVIAVGVAIASLARSSGPARVASATATVTTAAPASPTSPPPVSPTPLSFIGTIKTDFSELRASPGESGALVGTLNKGTRLSVLLRTADNNWLRVKAADGTEGWVSAKAIDLGSATIAAIPQTVLQGVPTPTPDLAATADACKPAAQVTNVTVQDGSQFKPGEAFVKTWRLASSGNCPWEKGSTLVFQTGEKFGAPDSIQVDTVDVGKPVEVSLNMKAPQAPGAYTGGWALQRPSGQAVTTLTVNIVVPSPTPTKGAAAPTAPPAAKPTATAAGGGIPPVGSGEFATDESASGPWNCVRISDSDWMGDFYIGVYGGSGNYTISDTANCRWDTGQNKFVCRYGARFDGSVNQQVQISCPGCRPIKVVVSGRTGTSGKEWCGAK
jgi:tRNA A-37 threonylcarbamoyl transferase component Bud32/SH3-like domain-containing protein